MAAGWMLLGDLAFWSMLAGSKIPGHESIPTGHGVWSRAQYVVGSSMEIYQIRTLECFLCFFRVLIEPTSYMRLTLIGWCPCLHSDLWAKSLLHMVLLWLLSLFWDLWKGKNRAPYYCFTDFVFKKKKTLLECWFRYSKNLVMCWYFVCL